MENINLFFNKDSSINMYVIDLKCPMGIPNILPQRLVSQIFYLGSSSSFMWKIG